MTPQESIQAVRVDMTAVNAYIGLLFGYADWSDGSIVSLLGIGEKGTPAEGRLRERKFIDPRSAFAGAAVQGHLERWGLHHGGAFIVPAMVRPEAEGEGDVRLDKVSALTAIILDIDSGDTHAKRAYVEQHLGPATFIVDSGGVTAEGTPKQHLYWRLSEVEEDIEYVGSLRKQLARKCGGDQSFGRATQVIRIPGSIHGKSGVQRMVTLHSVDENRDYHLSDLAEAIEAMPVMPGCEAVESNVIQLPLVMANGMMDFSAAAGRDGGALQTALTSTIAEGGDADRNRWTEFSRVAGFEISLVRQGRQKLEQAAEKVHGWVLGHMSPPWPPERIRTEWVALLNLDMKQHGPLVEAAVVKVEPALPVTATNERINSMDDLLSWAVFRRSSLTPPQRRDLVDNMIIAGQRHVLVAEGGAGKTFLMMDLMMKLAAAGSAPQDQYWLGQRVTNEAHDGTVILFTAEEGQDALDRRWARIDPGMKLREAAGERLIVVPFENIGGTFAFAGRNPHSGQIEATPQWQHMMNQVIALANSGRKIIAVGVDTFNATHHANENDALEIAQYMRAITPITGELGAAFLFTHHVKKSGKEPIKTPGDMLDAIRGSSAIKDNVRVAIGIWPSPDWRKEMRHLGLKPRDKQMFKAAVVKANEPLHEGVKSLMKNPDTSLLEDVTLPLAAAAGRSGERKAWVEFCIGWYADQGFFFNLTSPSSGIYRQRERFGEMFASATKREMIDIAEDLIGERRLIQRTVIGKGSQPVWLDLKSKAKTRRAAGENGREPNEPVWDDFFYEPTTNKVIGLAKPQGE